MTRYRIRTAWTAPGTPYINVVHAGEEVYTSLERAIEKMDEMTFEVRRRGDIAHRIDTSSLVVINRDGVVSILKLIEDVQR